MGKLKNNDGFSLVEVMVAMVILGLIIVPVTTGMTVSLKTMNKAEEMMHSQLAVSSAVETLTARGITDGTAPEMDGVKISVETVAGKPYYNVTVVSEDGLVTVKTVIRKAGG